MDLVVDHELKDICVSIEARSLNEAEWAEIESDDEFQSKNYCGGFDADENAFCFSYYAASGQELWFQFSLSEVKLVISGSLTTLAARGAEDS